MLFVFSPNKASFHCFLLISLGKKESGSIFVQKTKSYKLRDMTLMPQKPFESSRKISTLRGWVCSFPNSWALGKSHKWKTYAWAHTGHEIQLEMLKPLESSQEPAPNFTNSPP